MPGNLELKEFELAIVPLKVVGEVGTSARASNEVPKAEALR